MPSSSNARRPLLKLWLVLALCSLPTSAWAHGSGWEMSLLFLVPIDALAGVVGVGLIAFGKAGFANVSWLGRVAAALFLVACYALIWKSPARYFLAPPWVLFGATALPLLLTFGGRWLLARLSPRAAAVAGVSFVAVCALLALSLMQYIESRAPDEQVYERQFQEARRLNEAIESFRARHGRLPTSVAELQPAEEYEALTYQALSPDRYAITFPAPRYGPQGLYYYDSTAYGVGLFFPTVDGEQLAVKQARRLPWYLRSP